MKFPVIEHAVLLRRRNSYSYPAIGLEGQAPNWREITFPSMSMLDAYLTKKLNSSENAEVIHGYIATLFWGHASSADGRDIRARAHGKIRLAYQGQRRTVKGKEQQMRGVLDVGENAVVGHIRSAIEHIHNDRYGSALAELNKLPQIQVAFSSKLCAFISPEKCGVIDSKIAENFPELGFSLRNGYVTDTVTNRESYGEYCLWLQAKATTLNTDANHAQWIDRDGSKNRWRAVDVERALYG
ncbi:8-oxoguanine DNA glycosylase OGG fold protein [Chitinilyticum piscinae]|uniref:Uncharacterized protein n=1 Tax=Chitinilyticum piscinae TaxID=2866724 RepID=A0A8J7FRC5_9NEIS|nr:hypothetical protein [Chitinilyticum piscinae]MBE9610859.1 hypothetical protein [Chitinilyticum piscinae]